MLSSLQQKYIQKSSISLTVQITINIYPIESVFSAIDSQEVGDIFSAEKGILVFFIVLALEDVILKI